MSDDMCESDASASERLNAICVARPVIDEQLQVRQGVVLSSGPHVAYVGINKFVICVSRDPVPRLPNGIVIDGDVRGALVPGVEARLTAGCLSAGDARVIWSPEVSIWESKVPTTPASRAHVAGRGLQIMRALGHRPQGRKKTGELVEQLITGLDVALRATGGAVTQLFDALAANDANRLSRAAHTLLGRGPGLTPEGDDLLAAASGTLIVVGRTCGLPPEVIPRLLHALLPADRHERTTALGATLLELASRGHLAEPVHPLLDLERNTDTAHARDVSKLLGIGGSTGRAYAIGVAATLLTLSSRTARDPKREP